MKSGRKHHVTATNDDKRAGDSEGEEDENPKTRRRKVSRGQVSTENTVINPLNLDR